MILSSIDKIQFVFFGMNLLEPNAFITDGILGVLIFYFGLKISRLQSPNRFFTYWKRFLILFGIGAFLGGIGHTFYNYFGLPGKTPAWFLGIISVYFIEMSMVSIHPNKKIIHKLTMLSSFKLILVLSTMLLVVFYAFPESKEYYCMLIVIFNSLLGVVLSTGILGYYYYRLGMSQHYGFMVIGVLIMIPSSAVFIFDVNIHQWFDKNDLSHLILGIGIAFFYAGLVRLYKQEPKHV